MSTYKIIHLFFGEYVFETDASVFPRFANLLSQEKLNFWAVNRKEDRVSFHCSVLAAEDIVNLAKTAKIPLKIITRKGLPFLFSRYRHRYGLMVGLAVGLFLVFFSQLFIWKIDISGNRELTEYQVEQALAECGVKVGGFIPRLDPNYAENILLLKCRDLSSAVISIKGNHIIVSVLERTYMPEIIDKNGYYNVIAAEDGIVMDIDAGDGTPEVREGDVVYKGQLLINSFMVGKNGSYRPTHACGTVYAAVNRQFKTEIPLNRVAKHYSGRTRHKTRYEVLGWAVPTLFGDEADYEYFDAISARKKIKLFGIIELPVVKYSITYTEYTPQPQAITLERAKEYANSELKDYLGDLDAEVLQCKTDFYHDKKNGICVLTANAVVRLDIAREVEFNLNQSMSERLEMDRE